jgi:hypothetical protein
MSGVYFMTEGRTVEEGRREKSNETLEGGGVGQWLG